MRKLNTFLTTVLIYASVLLPLQAKTNVPVAKAPEKMSYQAVIRNSGNTIVASSQIGMKISLLQGSSEGNPVYAETQTPTSNTNGLVSFEIGGGTIVSGTFAGIDWSAGPYFIKTETDIAGGTNYTITGTSQLLSTPYALFAKNGITNGTQIGDLSCWNGTAWEIIPIGLPGQFLQVSTSNHPAWVGATYPSLSTISISDLASFSATSGVNILNDGGAPVTARGICWSTSANPVITGSHTSDGTGIGSVASSATGLSKTTLYYLRAYATNSVGTTYGNELSFTTPDLLLGDTFQGGKVFYFLKSGDTGYDPNVVHGLIASTTDQTTFILSAPMGSFPTSTDLGTGSANTSSIVSSYGAGDYAESLCKSLVLNSYSDWYLPSRDELSLMFTNRVIIGNFVVNGVYISSSLYQLYDFWFVQFIEPYNDFMMGYNPGGYTSITNRGGGYSVRAIRSF